MSIFSNLFQKERDFSYPLAIQDAATGEELKQHVPKERIYRVGPFYCDISPTTHTGAFKEAIDFIVRDGSLVYAARSGVIVDIVEKFDTFGDGPAYANQLNYVTIEHEDGLMSQYAHLQKDSVSSLGLYVGKHIVRRQTIGVVGKTGWVEGGENGDHLHFMVFKESGNTFESVSVTFIKDT